MPSTKAAGTGEATVFPKKVYLLVQHFNRVLEDFKTEPKVWHNVKKLSTFISAHNALGFAEIAATHAADLLRTFYIEEKGIMSIIYGGANLKETAKVTIVQNSLEFVVCEFEIKAVDMETSEFNPLSMLQVYDTDKRPGNVGSEDYDPYRSWLTANSHEGPDFAEELDPHFAQTKVPQWKRRDEVLANSPEWCRGKNIELKGFERKDGFFGLTICNLMSWLRKRREQRMWI